MSDSLITFLGPRMNESFKELTVLGFLVSFCRGEKKKKFKIKRRSAV